MQLSRLLLASTATLIATGAATAQANYAEGFDSQAGADVQIWNETDTIVTFVDYGNMTVGATSFNIPEAPRRIPGSAPTRGVLMQCNLTLGSRAGVNILAGATPITFSGRYRLSYDCYIKVANPVPTGGTEQCLFGVGTDGSDGTTTNPIESRGNRGTGAQGVYGWVTGENGYTFEDASINEGATNLEQYGDLQPGEDIYFNEAFNQPVAGGTNNAAGNQWVRVDVDVDGNNVRVYYNGILFFDEAATLAPTGFAMIGYEDPFNSISASPDEQWCLVDNFRVVDPTGCAAAGVSAIQGAASGATEILNGGGEPIIGHPFTIRLRGGTSSGFALLNAGLPSPVTIPLPFAGCTLNTEVVGTFFNLLIGTDALGNGEFTINVPLDTNFCGAAFGFQFYSTSAATPCGVEHSAGLSMTIGS